MDKPPKPAQMVTEEVAAFLRTSPSTVRYWRQTGFGPRGRKVGRRVLYDRSEVEKWLENLTDTELKPGSAVRAKSPRLIEHAAAELESDDSGPEGGAL